MYVAQRVLFLSTNCEHCACPFEWLYGKGDRGDCNRWIPILSVRSIMPWAPPYPFPSTFNPAMLFPILRITPPASLSRSQRWTIPLQMSVEKSAHPDLFSSLSPHCWCLFIDGLVLTSKKPLESKRVTFKICVASSKRRVE